LLDFYGRFLKWLASHIDLSSLACKKCALDLNDPSTVRGGERGEGCPFGRQVLVCVIGPVQLRIFLMLPIDSLLSLG